MSMTGERLCAAYEQAKASRSSFDTHWQTLHDYFYVEGDDSNRSSYPGNELCFDSLYDTLSLNTADVLAAGLTNYLTPPTTKWFGLTTKNPALMQSKNVKQWLQDTEDELYHILNNSNFYNQITPFYKSSGVYGTAVMLEEEDVEDGVRFYGVPLKQTCIVEDARGRVREFYIQFDYTAVEAVDRFGLENVSEKVKEEFIKGERNSDKKHKYLLVIKPRNERDPYKQDKANMPIAAIWVDAEDKKIVKESGYMTMPAFAHRFYKRIDTPWGYSPAMKALADVRWLNAASKTLLRGAMKASDPAIALPSNSFILPLDFNSRALNFYKKGSLSRDDIFEIGNGGNPNINMEFVMYKAQAVKSLMFTDVFLAFEGLTKQMTVPEVMQRVTEKMTLLGPAVGRFQSDVLNNIVERTLGIAMKLNMLPPVPDEMIEDPRYEIEYKSALALAQKNTSMTALRTALSMAGEISQFNPSVLDKIDADKVVDVTWGILGADVSVLRSSEEVEEIRDARAEEAFVREQAEIVERASAVGETQSKTAKNISEANND